MAICVKCKGKTEQIKVNFKGHKIDAHKCKKCGEEYFEPKQAQRILEKRKQKFSRGKTEGIFPTLMEALEEISQTIERTVSVLENLDARLKVLEVDCNDRKRRGK